MTDDALPDPRLCPQRLPYEPGTPAYRTAMAALVDEYFSHYEGGIAQVVAILSTDRYPAIPDYEAFAQEAAIACFRYAHQWRGIRERDWVNKVTAMARTMAYRAASRAKEYHHAPPGGEFSYEALLERRGEPGSQGDENEIDQLLYNLSVEADARSMGYDASQYWHLVGGTLDLLAAGGSRALSRQGAESICELGRLIVEGGLIDWRPPWGIALIHLLREREWPGLITLLPHKAQRRHLSTVVLCVYGDVFTQKWGMVKEIARATGKKEASIKRGFDALRTVERELRTRLGTFDAESASESENKSEKEGVS